MRVSPWHWYRRGDLRALRWRHLLHGVDDVLSWVLLVVREKPASVPRLPGLAHAGCRNVLVRPDALCKGTQILPQHLGRGPAPVPVAIVDLVDDQARLEHERVRDHGIVVWVRVLLDVEVFLHHPL